MRFKNHRFLDQTPLPASKQVSQLNAPCGALLVVASGRISRECLLLGQFFCTYLRYNSDHEPAPWVPLDNLEFFFCQTRVSGYFPGTTEQKILAMLGLQICLAPDRISVKRPYGADVRSHLLQPV